MVTRRANPVLARVRSNPIRADDSISSARNAQMALTALSTYAKLSSERSLIFSRLATEFTDLLSPSISSTLMPISRKGKERAGSTNLSSTRLKRLWLGERNITFQRGPIGLVVRWDIRIDSLGFAESHLTLATKLPQECTFTEIIVLILGREADEKGVLDSLDGVFDSFVRKFGVEKAVQGIVGVVFESD